MNVCPPGLNVLRLSAHRFVCARLCMLVDILQAQSQVIFVHSQFSRVHAANAVTRIFLIFHSAYTYNFLLLLHYSVNLYFFHKFEKYKETQRNKIIEAFELHFINVACGSQIESFIKRKLNFYRSDFI